MMNPPGPVTSSTGHQANHAALQINAGDVHIGTLGHVPFPNSAAPQEKRPPVLSFYFGSLVSLDEDQDGEIDLRPLLPKTPIITLEQSSDISSAGASVQIHYKELIKSLPKLKSSCMINLSKKAEVQMLCIEQHVKSMEKWVQPKPSASRRSGSNRPETNIQKKIEEVRDRLQTIQGKISEAMSILPELKEWWCTRNRQQRRQAAKSAPFRSIDDLISKIQSDIAFVEGQVGQLSGVRRPLETMRGFARLRIASRATKTLYQYLCRACPLADSEQGHSHNALVGLAPVPGKEQFCIEPNTVACTAHHVAIESTLVKGDHIWFEAVSNLLIPGEKSDDMQGDGAELRSAAEKEAHLRRDSGYSSSSSSAAREEMKISLARGEAVGNMGHIQVCPGSLAQGSAQLAMCIGDEQYCGHQMRYLHEDIRPGKTADPLCLTDIFEQGRPGRKHAGESYIRSRTLRKHRFHIAMRIAEGTLRYGWKEWLGDTWGSRDVFFYSIDSAFQPFLRAEMALTERESDSQEQFMFRLGIVLLEVGLWEQLHIPPKPGLVNSTLIEQEVSSLSTSAGAPYQAVVQYCIDFAGDSECGRNAEKFQETFYRKVVSPLRALVNSEASRMHVVSPEECGSQRSSVQHPTA